MSVFTGHLSPAWDAYHAALTANKAARPRRKTGTGPTITDLESE